MLEIFLRDLNGKNVSLPRSFEGHRQKASLSICLNRALEELHSFVLHDRVVGPPHRQRGKTRAASSSPTPRKRKPQEGSIAAGPAPATKPGKLVPLDVRSEPACCSANGPHRGQDRRRRTVDREGKRHHGRARRACRTPKAAERTASINLTTLSCLIWSEKNGSEKTSSFRMTRPRPHAARRRNPVNAVKGHPRSQRSQRGDREVVQPAHHQDGVTVAGRSARRQVPPKHGRQMVREVASQRRQARHDDRHRSAIAAIVDPMESRIDLAVAVSDLNDGSRKSRQDRLGGQDEFRTRSAHLQKVGNEKPSSRSARFRPTATPRSARWSPNCRRVVAGASRSRPTTTRRRISSTVAISRPAITNAEDGRRTRGIHPHPRKSSPRCSRCFRSSNIRADRQASAHRGWKRSKAGARHARRQQAAWRPEDRRRQSSAIAARPCWNIAI